MQNQPHCLQPSSTRRRPRLHDLDCMRATGPTFRTSVYTCGSRLGLHPASNFTSEASHGRLFSVTIPHVPRQIRTRRGSRGERVKNLDPRARIAKSATFGVVCALQPPMMTTETNSSHPDPRAGMTCTTMQKWWMLARGRRFE